MVSQVFDVNLRAWALLFVVVTAVGSNIETQSPLAWRVQNSLLGWSAPKRGDSVMELKKRFSVKKWIRSKAKRARTAMRVGTRGCEASEAEADQTVSFLDPTESESQIFCDEPAGEVDGDGRRTESVETA